MERQAERERERESHLSLHCISRFHFPLFDLTLIQLPVKFTYDCGRNASISNEARVYCQ